MRKTTKIATKIYARERAWQLIKLAVGGMNGLKVPGYSAPATGGSDSSGPSNTISPIPAAVPKALNAAGKAVWNNGGQTAWNNVGQPALSAGLNTMSGISTTGVGATNAAAGTIGGGAARVGRLGTQLTDATGLTNGATNWVNHNITRHMDNAAIAGVKDVVGGAADTLSGGYYDYDGSNADTGRHKGTAVQQQRSGIRDELGRGSDLDTAFQRATGVSNAAADMAAFGGAGRGLNVASKAIQGSRVAPALGAVAKTPVVGKPLAAAGNWMAGQAPAANMFTQNPVEYYRAAINGGGGGAVASRLAPYADEVAGAAGRVAGQFSDDVVRNVVGVGQQLGDDALNVAGNINPADVPADYAATQQGLEIEQQMNGLQNQANRADNTDYAMSRQMLHDPAIQNRIQNGAIPVDAATQLVQQRGAVPEEQQAGHIAALSQNVSQGGQFNVSDQQQPQDQAGLHKFLPEDAPPEAREQTTQAATAVQQNPIAREAVQDPKVAAKVTEEAKPKFDQQAQEEYAAAVPQPTNGNPQDYGKWMADMGTHIEKSWGDMGPMGQLAFGLGVPMALIGMMSGNIGGFLMGALGLGAAGMAGAAGGMFGQGGQDAMGNMIDFGAQALGMNVPKGPQDMSRLVGDDAVGNIQKDVAAKSKTAPGESFRIATNPKARAAKQESVRAHLSQVDSVKSLAGMSEPTAVAVIMAKHRDPQTGKPPTREVAQQIYQNAIATAGHLNNPDSEMAKQVATGRQFDANPAQYIAQQAGPYIAPAMKYVTPALNFLYGGGQK